MTRPQSVDRKKERSNSNIQKDSLRLGQI